MKLFPSLSILHLAAAGSDFHVEGCLSVAVPWGGLLADLDNQCTALGDAISAQYPDMEFRANTCFSTCSAQNEIGGSPGLAYSAGQLNPTTAAFGCYDVCVEAWNINEDAVGSDDEADVLEYIEVRNTNVQNSYQILERNRSSIRWLCQIHQRHQLQRI